MESALDSVESLEAFKCSLGIFRQFINSKKRLVVLEWLRFQGRDMDLFIACKIFIYNYQLIFLTQQTFSLLPE